MVARGQLLHYSRTIPGLVSVQGQNYSSNKMHPLLKHKMLQSLFKYISFYNSYMFQSLRTIIREYTT